METTSNDKQVRHGQCQVFCRLLDLELLGEDGGLMQVWKQGRMREIPLMQGREDRLLLMLSLIIPVLVNRCAPL